jgi:type IV pilus assembly protein PilP
MRPLGYVLLALAAAPFAALACSEPEVTHGPPPAPRAPPAAVLSASASSGPEYAESDFVENDRNRDPFRSYRSLFVDTGQKHAFVTQRKVILSQYGIDDLRLVAIVQGAEYPRAMFVDPRGKGWVLKRGDFVGRAETVHTGGTNGSDYQVNWRVDRVRDSDVVMIREDPARPNIAPTTRVIPLHPETENKGGDNEDLTLGPQGTH